MKKSWGVIKSNINKNQKTHIQGRFKIGKNLITSDNELISNKFNDFFINIGPTLAKSIPHINKNPLSYLGNRLTETIYSVSPIYRGRVYRGIGYIAVACWTPFFGAQERDIFREIAVTPWTQFAGDNFSRNLLTAIAFVPGSQETIFREINSSLPVNAGGTHAVQRSATLGGALTPPLCRRVRIKQI